MRAPRLQVLLLSAILLSGCSSPARRDPAAAGTEDTSFTFIALPDTQYYSQKLPAAFLSQTRWIVKNLKERNIQFVVGLGDVVDDGNSTEQWSNAAKALEVLRENHVPMFLSAGNHDYSPPFWDANPHPRSTANFNKYFGPGFYREQPSFAGTKDPGATENTFGLIRAGNRDFLILILEFSPRDSTLEWASKVVQEHPSHDVIVATHSYMYSDDTRVDGCAQYNKRNYALKADNDGAEIWSKFAIKHPNVRLILSGHIPNGAVGKRYDVGLQGNLVNQILSDYQAEPNAGNGWLRIMTVRPALNRIEVQTYSPYLEEHPELGTPAWRTDAANQFSIDYENPMPGRFTAGTIQGRVRVFTSNSVCAGVPGATVKYPGGSAKTDAEGRFTAQIPGDPLSTTHTYQSVELSVEKAGWKPVIHRATVKDGGVNVEQILLERLKPSPSRRGTRTRARAGE